MLQFKVQSRVKGTVQRRIVIALRRENRDYTCTVVVRFHPTFILFAYYMIALYTPEYDTIMQKVINII